MKKLFLLFLALLTLAGCTTIVKYVDYTDRKFPPKQKYYFISVYGAQPPAAVAPFQVIGRVEISGLISDGVNADALTDQAKRIARARGADAIINAKIEKMSYNEVEVIPGHYGRRYYHPAEYYSRSNMLLTFRGELIVFVPAQGTIE
jgi:hypothetical protein